MEWWGLAAGVAIGFAVATLGAWQARRALSRRQAKEIEDAAPFGWMSFERPPRADDVDDGNENGNENRS